MSSWLMEGPYLKICNCDPGCPCDFNQAPTHGHCHGAVAMQIDHGHFGDVSLDGVKWATLVKWPGRMDEGDGHAQAIIDAEASDEQVQALGTILSGAAGGTIFQILDAVCPHKHDPVRAPISFEWDIESRTAHVTAGDVFETRAETLRGIDPPDPYRVKVWIPGGFEYLSEDESAEVALATMVRSTADIEMDVVDGNANFAYVKHEGEVPVAA
jgi:hypothetical protein